MHKSGRGGASAKYLALIFFLSLLVGFFYWKESYGTVGHVEKMPETSFGRIAFLRQEKGQTNLFIIDSTGSDLRQLTDSASDKRTPAWSPDGRRICYASEPEAAGPDGRAFQLFIVGGGKPRQITYGSISKDQPQWSPDGRLIAFLTGGVIKVIQPNGDGLRQVYPPPHKGGEHEEDHSDEDSGVGKKPPISHFHWAPVGAAIAGVQITEGENAFTVGKTRWWDESSRSPTLTQPIAPEVMEPESLIILPSVDSGKVDRPPSATADRIHFSWFPDGRRIAVALATRQGQHALMVYRADDMLVQPVPVFGSTGNTIAVERPAVSPDGRKIAFEVWRLDGAENRELIGIQVIDAEADRIAIRSAADAAKLTARIKGGHEPQWSPDGSKLLFWRYGNNGRDIWVASADGSGEKNLTNGSGDNIAAVWSPARR